MPIWHRQQQQYRCVLRRLGISIGVAAMVETRAAVVLVTLHKEQL
jgi:hypothetical protein